jgi:hypothetical protein
MHKSFSTSFEKTAGIWDGFKNLLKGVVKVEHSMNPQQMAQIESQLSRIPKIEPWQLAAAPLLAGFGASVGTDLMNSTKSNNKGML